ncbi:MAG: ATP-binding protein [Elusimicrobia bacterium]|nr:ATP-binding protein [Elusimicrobiota bacterium]
MNRIELMLTNLRSILHGPKVPPLAQYLNLWSLWGDTLIGVNLDFSSVYELEFDNIFLMEPGRQDLFSAQSRSFLNALPPDATLQFLVRIRKGDPEALREHRQAVLGENPEDFARAIIEKKCEFIEGKFIQRRRYFLYVTSHPRERKTPLTFILPTFNHPWREVTRDYHELRIKEHSALEQIVSERLHSMGLRFRKLAGQEVLDLVFDQLNPGRPRGIAAQGLSPFRTIREQAAFYPLKEEFDHVQVNGTYFKGLGLLRLPEVSHLGYTQKLINSLWPDSDLCLTVHSLDTEGALSSLKLRNNITRTLAFSAWTKNYEAEQKHLELDEMITEIRASAQRLFRFGLSVLVRADSLDELKDKTNPVIGAFHDFASAEAASDDMNHFRLYLQSIPGHGELNDRKFYVQTNALAGFLPLTGSWRGSRQKKMLVETPLGELVGLDPFDDELPAKHGLILGTTGSGKSFTTNYILSNFMVESKNNHVVLIDVGGSYRKLARSFNGEYLEVALSEEFGFNPFPLRAHIAPGGQFDDDAVAYLSLLISRMCVEQGTGVSVYQKGFLEKAIKAAYADKEEVVLSDIRAQLFNLAKEHPTAKAFADALELWTSGMYGRLFNRPGALDISNRMVVFDLQNLENHPDLQGVYFFVIRSIIWGKLQNRALKKIIAIDEGWKFFNDDVGAELIENLYRTARKFNGAVFSISQSPADFLETRAAKAIITNSYIKYILKLTKGHELLSQFDLNSNEVEAVKQLQSKQGVFTDVFAKYGNHSMVVRIEPCPLDYWICTTDAKDRVREDQVRADNPGISETDLLLKLAEAR